MRVLYSVCGEGLGHSSRARSVVEHLKKEGHEVLIFTYGRALDVLSDFSPVDIFGIELEYSEGKMSVWRTYFSNRKKFYERLRDFPLIKDKLNEFSPEICISDMEPIVPIISFWKGLPLISIDNQHSLVFSKVKVPLKYKKAFYIARAAIKRCISKANCFIVLSFMKEDVGRDNVSYVSPILRDDISKMKPIRGDFNLVYLSNRDDELEEVLSKVNERFVVYGGSRERSRVKNILYKKKGKGFMKDLEKCKSVIATSGFSLMSEALYLKKPYFAIPLKGQFEQFANSLYLEKSGFGVYSEDPTLEELNGFFSRLKVFEKKLKRYRVDSGEAFRVLDRVLDRLGKV